MVTFALVHGAWHGAWCWEALVRELESRGAAAVTVDLPSDDVANGCSEYADVVVESLRGVSDDVVVVGHSLGGLTIPLVAAARPVSRLVVLCGFVPRPGKGPWELEAGEPLPWREDSDAGFERDELGRSVWRDTEAAVAFLYADCDPDVARAAAARLRPQGPLPNSQACPLAELPNVPFTVMYARDDAAVSPDWVRWTAANRLGGVDPIELPGDHSPMLARPAELAELLLRTAQ